MSLNDRLAAFFKAHPHEWMDGRTLAEVAGAYAWRSRVSDLRRKRGMTIENEVKHYGRGAKKWSMSWYRYVPPAETAASASEGHDLNVPWSLR